MEISKERNLVTVETDYRRIFQHSFLETVLAAGQWNGKERYRMLFTLGLPSLLVRCRATRKTDILKKQEEDRKWDRKRKERKGQKSSSVVGDVTLTEVVRILCFRIRVLDAATSFLSRQPSIYTSTHTHCRTWNQGKSRGMCELQGKEDSCRWVQEHRPTLRTVDTHKHYIPLQSCGNFRKLRLCYNRRFLGLKLKNLFPLPPLRFLL